jgi:hypothetical protein
MVTCGIDWAQDHHDIAIVDAEGRRVAKRRIPESVAGLTELTAMLAEAGDDPKDPIPVAIEIPRGLLVAALRASGRPIYPINPMSVARYRERSRWQRSTRCLPAPSRPTRCRARWPNSSFGAPCSSATVTPARWCRPRCRSGCMCCSGWRWSCRWCGATSRLAKAAVARPSVSASVVPRLASNTLWRRLIRTRRPNSLPPLSRDGKGRWRSQRFRALAAEPRRRGRWRTWTPLVVHAVTVQALVFAVRPSVSYAALDAGVAPALIGLVTRITAHAA